MLLETLLDQARNIRDALENIPATSKEFDALCVAQEKAEDLVDALVLLKP